MTPIISKTDYKKIIHILSNLSPNQKTSEAKQLIEELAKSKIVSDKSIKDDVIRINSEIEVEVINSNQKLYFTLTVPSESNVIQKKISILSGMGVALIGLKEGTEVEWRLPGGLMKLKILKVNNPF